MSIAADHLADIRFAHFDFEDQLATLLDLCHQNLFRRFDQLPDDKLEKSLHGKSLCRRRDGSLAGFQDHARDRRAGLSAMRHPILNASEIQLKIITGNTWIVIADHFNEFTITGTAFVRHHYPIVRTVFSSFSS
jgi:hypothetical protein